MSNSSNKKNNKSSKKTSTKKSNTTKNNTVTNKQESKSTTVDTNTVDTNNTSNTKTSVNDKLVKQYTKAELAQEYSKLQDKFNSVKKDLDRTKSFSSTVERELEQISKLHNKAKEEVENLSNTVNVLSSEKNMLIDKVNESVPKEILRSEKLVNRLNWYYKDLKGWERITAHIILLVALSGICLGLYYILNIVINNEQLFNTIAPIVLSLLGISGITFQASSLKSPNKK